MSRRLFGAIALCAGICGVANAQVLGMIDYMEGSAVVTRNGSDLGSVRIGTPIENLDIVRTSTDGLVSIAFSKSSGLSGTLQIVPGTTAVIRQDQVSGATVNEVQLMIGSINLKVDKLAGKNPAIQVRTPSSVLGVRGTEFVVATFNGSSIVACGKGDVYCASSSGMDVTRMKLPPIGSKSSYGEAAVPGTMVEIAESGSLRAGAFPSGEFEKNWKETREKWKNLGVNLIVGNPITSINQYATNWSLYSAKVDAGAAKLRANAVLKAWLKDAAAGRVSGSFSSWVKEKPAVMADLVAMRADMMIAMMTWYRLQEVIPYLPQSSMSAKLANGQTLKSFVDQFNRSSKSVALSFALFNAAEKQYMLRNEGLSPFSEF